MISMSFPVPGLVHRAIPSRSVRGSSQILAATLRRTLRLPLVATARDPTRRNSKTSLWCAQSVRHEAVCQHHETDADPEGTRILPL